MNGLIWACLSIVAFAVPAVAKEEIWNEAFVGTYERIGRDAATPPGLVNDSVYIDVAGDDLTMRQCGAGGTEAPTRFEFLEMGDITNILHASETPSETWCLYHNNGDNMFILTCTTAEGARLTYWPKLDLPCAE